MSYPELEEILASQPDLQRQYDTSLLYPFVALVRELPPNKGIGTIATLVQPQVLETALPNYSPASLRVVLAKYMALTRFKVASMPDHQRTI